MPETTAEGVVPELRDSEIDIIVIQGDGDDTFIKVGDKVLLIDETEAQTLAEDILNTLDIDLDSLEIGDSSYE